MPLLSLVLFVVPVCSWLPEALAQQPGDVTHDGCVDLADFAVVQNAFTGPECAQPVGACCAPGGGCSEVPAFECVPERYRGDGTSCASVPCPGPHFVVPMSLVPGGGAGPAYAFEIGTFEVTNAQFAAFLNDAQLDGGATYRGSSMAFEPNGRVRVVGDEIRYMFLPAGAGGTTSYIEYTHTAPLGERYQVRSGFEQHPVNYVDWLGALKFCNWLTIDQGLPESELCYTEGATVEYWHPVTIAYSAWNSPRDLDQFERQSLVANYRGFRLPMDNKPTGEGYLSNEENPYNEWFKAAAYDPAAPDYERPAPQGSTLSAFHWAFGFGRDTISPGDANFDLSLDPYDNGTTPVGFYDGVNWLANNVARTNDTRNPWGCYDLSGNVREWLQDRAGGFPGGSRALRGGAYDFPASALATNLRHEAPYWNAANINGFRVVRVP